MTVYVRKPTVPVSETLADLRKTTGVGGELVLRQNSKTDVNNVLNVAPNNIIINGAMQVQQRPELTNGVISGNNYYDFFACDRWKFGYGGSDALQVDITAEVDAPAPFTYSLKWKNDNTKSVAGSTYQSIWTRQERRRYLGLGIGTPEAKDLTLSFWVKSNRPGQFAGIHILYPSAGGAYSINFTYVIHHADTWEYKVIVLPTSGLVDDTYILQANSGDADYLAFHLAAGSTYDSAAGSTLTYITYATANWASGQKVDLCEIVDSTFYLTGVSLVIGAYPEGVPFDFRSPEEEEALCGRFYQKFISDSTNQNIFGVGVVDGATDAFVQMPLSPPMRANPTKMYTTGTASDYAVREGGGTTTVCNAVPTMSGDSNPRTAIVNFSTSSGMTADSACMGRAVTNGAYLAFDAEL